MKQHCKSYSFGFILIIKNNIEIMKARVIENIKTFFENGDIQGNVYHVHEVVGTRVTINYPHRRNKLDKPLYKPSNPLGTLTYLIDLTLDEVELLMEGRNVEVYRNQGTRNGNWIGFKKGKGYALRYVMPNGKCFINICKNPFKLDDYTTISEDKFNTLFNI